MVLMVTSVAAVARVRQRVTRVGTILFFLHCPRLLSINLLFYDISDYKQSRKYPKMIVS
jgi:hypothetical protein